MKKALLLLLFPLYCQSQTEVAKEHPRWMTNYASALETARAENKNLLLYFTGSDWCPPCKVLKKDFFQDPAFLDQSDNYILLYIDLPRGRGAISSDQLLHNQKLLERWNSRRIFPLLVIIDQNEDRLGKLAGYGMDGNIKRHVKLLSKHAN